MDMNNSGLRFCLKSKNENCAILEDFMELKLVVILLLLFQTRKFACGAPIDSDSTAAEKALMNAVGEAAKNVNATESMEDKFDEDIRSYVPSEDYIPENSTNAMEEKMVKASVNPSIPEFAAATNATTTVDKILDEKTQQTSPEAITASDSAVNQTLNAINETTLPESPSNATDTSDEKNPLDDLTIPLPISVTLKPPKSVTDDGVILPNSIENETSLPEWFTKDRYQPSNLPAMDNKVFNEFMRLSKLTQYMLLDPKFAEDYQKGNLTSLTKVLFVVYGDAVKHIFSSPTLTYSGPPQRKSRIRFRIKSLNDQPPIKCSEMGRETARLFCPFSYGYRWWDCLMPDEVCDGIPHCGLGDDEDPKMCLYYKAALSQFQRAQHTAQAAQSRQQPPGHKVIVYNPAKI